MDDITGGIYHYAGLEGQRRYYPRLLFFFQLALELYVLLTHACRNKLDEMTSEVAAAVNETAFWRNETQRWASMCSHKGRE